MTGPATKETNQTRNLRPESNKQFVARETWFDPKAQGMAIEPADEA